MHIIFSNKPINQFQTVGFKTSNIKCLKKFEGHSEEVQSISKQCSVKNLLRQVQSISIVVHSISVVLHLLAGRYLCSYIFHSFNTQHMTI